MVCCWTCLPPVICHQWWQTRWSSLLPNQWPTQQYIWSLTFMWLLVWRSEWSWSWVHIPIDWGNKLSDSTWFTRGALPAFNLYMWQSLKLCSGGAEPPPWHLPVCRCWCDVYNSKRHYHACILVPHSHILNCAVLSISNYSNHEE